MWVLNTETDVTWEVEGELAERLAADPAYRVVDAPSDEADAKPAKKAPTKEG